MVLTRSGAIALADPASQRLSRYEQVGILKSAEIKLERACKTVVLLNDKIMQISRHYHRAKAASQRVFRYNLRVKLAIYEGVRNVFYEYCRDRAEDIAELRRLLFNQRVLIITPSDRENEPDIVEDEPDFDEDEQDFDEDEPDFGDDDNDGEA